MHSKQQGQTTKQRRQRPLRLRRQRPQPQRPSVAHRRSPQQRKIYKNGLNLKFQMQNDKMSAFKKLKGAKLTHDDMKEVRERARVEYDALTEEARCDRLRVFRAGRLVQQADIGSPVALQSSRSAAAEDQCGLMCIDMSAFDTPHTPWMQQAPWGVGVTGQPEQCVQLQ